MNLHKNSQSNYNVHPTLDILYFFAHYAQSVYFYIFKFPIKVTNLNLRILQEVAHFVYSMYLHVLWAFFCIYFSLKFYINA